MIEQLAPLPSTAHPDPPNEYLRDLVEPWLTTGALANGEALPARDLANDVFLSQFSHMDTSGQRVFDLWKAPCELIGIANRIDLHAPDGSHAGELRFAFEIKRPDGIALPATLVMEYRVPTSDWTVATWAAKWHELAGYEVGSVPYIQRLQALTTRVTNRAASYVPALIDIRTNEKAFDSQSRWDLREFRPTTDGFIGPAMTANSPRQSLNGSAILGAYVRQTPALSVDGTSFFNVVMPDAVVDVDGGAVPFLGAAASVGAAFKWQVPPANASGSTETQDTSVAVDNFGMLTCNGCHNDNKQSSDINFYYISPLARPGQTGVARLSSFLTAGDPSKGARRPAELTRRADEMRQILSIP